MFDTSKDTHNSSKLDVKFHSQKKKKMQSKVQVLVCLT